MQARIAALQSSIRPASQRLHRQAVHRKVIARNAFV
jgi:hypothetical protein